MVKKFTANCTFGSSVSPVTLYIGNPAKDSHPLAFQNRWLNSEKGGNIPSNVMDSFEKLADISNKNKVPFEDLCEYVIDEIQENNNLESDAARATEISEKNNNSDEG